MFLNVTGKYSKEGKYGTPMTIESEMFTQALLFTFLTL